MKKVLLLPLFFCVATEILSSTQTKERAAFDQLLSLAGDWEGTVAWSGGVPSQISAHYRNTGNGSAVVEDLSTGMMTVYHLDGNDLRMTHFCAAQNQPRLKATAFGRDHSGVTFSFMDITNLNSPGGGHVRGLDIRFLAPDHVTLLFHFVSNGKEKDELVDLKRKN